MITVVVLLIWEMKQWALYALGQEMVYTVFSTIFALLSLYYNFNHYNIIISRFQDRLMNELIHTYYYVPIPCIVNIHRCYYQYTYTQ